MIPEIVGMVILLGLSLYALKKLFFTKKKKKVCFGEYGFEGNNCDEYCSDVEECANRSN